MFTLKKDPRLHYDVTACHICRKKLAKDKNCLKVRDHCHYTGKYRNTTYDIYHLIFNIPNEFLQFFCKGSDYDYHFIVKRLANGLKGQFENTRFSRIT